MIVLLSGRPGSGKGTQTELIVERLGFSSFGFGETLRNIAKSNPTLKATMDSGKLVPIEIIDQLWGEFLATRTNTLSVIDGWPRDIEQAKWLVSRSQLHPEETILIIEIDTPISEVRQRLAVRGRDDDDETSVNTRLKVYDQLTVPALQMLARSLEYIKVDGSGTVDEVFDQIKQAIKKYQEQ